MVVPYDSTAQNGSCNPLCWWGAKIWKEEIRARPLRLSTLILVLNKPITCIVHGKLIPFSETNVHAAPKSSSIVRNFERSIGFYGPLLKQGSYVRSHGADTPNLAAGIFPVLCHMCGDTGAAQDQHRSGLLARANPIPPRGQLRNPLDGLPGNGGTLCGKHIDKLASDVGHAGHFRGFTFTEHAVETGIAIRMHPALITRQVLDRVLTLSIHCELIPNAGRCPSSTTGQIVCLCACGWHLPLKMAMPCPE